MTPFELIKSGDTNALSILLNEDSGLAGIKNEAGLSPLMFAAYFRNHDAIEIIRNKLAHISIFEACATGDQQTVGELIDMSNINRPSVDGFSPLGLACFFGHQNIVSLLLEKKADVNQASNNDFKVTPMHSACAISHYEIAEMLITAGADVNATQQSGVTPLHSAAHNGSLTLVELLLKNGADKKMLTNEGKSALNFAEEKHTEELYDLLKI